MKYLCSRATTRNIDTDEAPHPDAVREDGDWYLEIDTLSDLMSLSVEEGRPLIVEAERQAINTMTGEPMNYPARITIYDGYIE